MTRLEKSVATRMTRFVLIVVACFIGCFALPKQGVAQDDEASVEMTIESLPVVDEKMRKRIGFFPRTIPIYLSDKARVSRDIDVVSVRHALIQHTQSIQLLNYVSDAELRNGFDQASLEEKDAFVQAEIDMAYAETYAANFNFDTALTTLERVRHNYGESYAEFFEPKMVARAAQIYAYTLLSKLREIEVPPPEELHKVRRAFMDMFRLMPHIVLLEGRQPADRVRFYNEGRELFMKNAVYRQTSQANAAKIAQKLGLDLVAFFRIVQSDDGSFNAEIDFYELEGDKMVYSTFPLPHTSQTVDVPAYGDVSSSVAASTDGSASAAVSSDDGMTSVPVIDDGEDTETDVSGGDAVPKVSDMESDGPAVADAPEVAGEAAQEGEMTGDASVSASESTLDAGDHSQELFEPAQDTVVAESENLGQGAFETHFENRDFNTVAEFSEAIQKGLDKLYLGITLPEPEKKPLFYGHAHRFYLDIGASYFVYAKYVTLTPPQALGASLRLTYMFTEHFFISGAFSMSGVFQDKAKDLYETFQIFRLDVLTGISADFKYARPRLGVGLEYAYTTPFAITTSPVCKAFGQDDPECRDGVRHNDKPSMFGVKLVAGVDVGVDPLYFFADLTLALYFVPVSSDWFRVPVGTTMGIQYRF